MSTVTARFAQCVTRGQAVGITMCRMPDGSISTVRKKHSERPRFFYDLDRLEQWLESAEGLMVCKLTDSHRAEARACGWSPDTSVNHEGDGHTYVLTLGRRGEPHWVCICTNNFDVIESKLAKLKREGADLL